MVIPRAAICIAITVLAACAQPTVAPVVPPPGTLAPGPQVGPQATPAGTPNAQARARLDAARTALRAENYDAAIAEAEAATRADPVSSDAFYILGNIHNQLASVTADADKRQQALNRAADAYAKAINLNPRNDAALVNLGTVYYQNGQFDDAQKQVEAGLKINPNDATGQYILGTIHLQRDPATVPDTLGRAEQAFQAAIKIDPNMAVAYTGLATVNIFRQDYASAQKNAQKALDLMPDSKDPYVFWALAQAQCLGTDKPGGRRTIERIDALNAPDPRFKARVRELADKCR